VPPEIYFALAKNPKAIARLERKNSPMLRLNKLLCHEIQLSASFSDYLELIGRSRRLRRMKAHLRCANCASENDGTQKLAAHGCGRFFLEANHFDKSTMADWTGQSLFELFIHRCESSGPGFP
jgi:hypothetical protein